MDLETENRLAALLMEEARRLRLQADKEGVQLYLRQPNVRGHPNSRFLTATVLGVQQANRAVEISEMWRAREKEKELDAKSRAKGKSIRIGEKHHGDVSGTSSRCEKGSRNSDIYSSSKRGYEDCYSSDDDGLRDEEVEEFLHSRAKRGRGAIGSRMDEPGPYMSSTSSDHNGLLVVSGDTRVKEEWEHRILGPEKPSFMKSDERLKDACDTKAKIFENLKKHRSKERISEREKSRRRTRKESSSKHRHKRRRPE